MRYFATVCLVLWLNTSNAGTYSDDLAKCLVASTSQKDRTELVRWVFATIALHPEVADISNVSTDSRDQINRAVAELFERLLTDSCLKQTQDAVSHEGPIAMDKSFQVLGEIAFQDMTTNENFSGGLKDFVKYLDKAKFEAAFKKEPCIQKPSC